MFGTPVRHAGSSGTRGYELRDRFTQMFDLAVKRSGLQRIRLHDLRHTNACLLLAAGESPKVVSERLGHGNVAFTLEVYAHVIPAQERMAADRIGAVLLGGRGAITA